MMRWTVLGGCLAFAVAACGIIGGSSDDNSAAQTAEIVPTGNPNGHDDGLECTVGNDCKSGVCRLNTCQAPTHSDGVKNGDETGLDCGGATAPKCGGGQGCVADSDCTSGSCNGGACGGPKDPPPSPTDGKKNGDETDVDCGGTVAPKCADTKGCNVAGDCTSGVCFQNACAAPTASDGVKNGDETDVDCGGTSTSAPGCAPGLACNVGTDCASKICGGDGKCTTPTSTDGVQNGDESDVDCGGTTTNAPKCDVGKSCNVHADCGSDGCDDSKHCALGRSCTRYHGGRTCGVGDEKDPAKQHESCCTALPVPGTGKKLDKYQITSGRMREFLARVNGNVKGWVQANRGALPAATQATLPAGYDGYLPDDMFTGPYAAALHVGGYVFLTDRPSTSQGCFIGPPNDPNYSSGSHTYWLDQTGRDLTGENISVNPQDRLDEKALNCVAYPILAAFCAWDGGRLASRPTIDAAYGAATYPWGSAPPPAGYTAAGSSTQTPTNGDLLRANWLYNYYRISSAFEDFNNGDYTTFVAPPGRYPAGAGQYGHMDLGGNVFDITSTAGANDSKYGATVKWSKNGSFEGHGVGGDGYQFAIMTKYGKAGGRCERD